MGVAKDVSSAAMPYVILGGIVIGAWVFRDKIKNWLAGAATSAIIDPVKEVLKPLVTDTNADNWNDAGTGVIDPNKPLWEGSLISINPFTGKPWFSKDDTASVAVTTEIPWYLQPVTPVTVPSFLQEPVSREPVTTPGYETALAGVSNLVTGSAADAYANAQAIRAAAAVPSSGWNFQTIKPLIEADGYTEFNLSPTLALGINQYGWDVHYTQDSGPWHEGQIISMTSGGNNPFGGGAFDAYLKQAIAYGGV